MAIIVNFDTTTLEGLVTALSAAQATETAAEAALNSADTSLNQAAAALVTPISEFSTLERLNREARLRSSLAQSGNAALTAASGAVTTALNNLEAYVASII